MVEPKKVIYSISSGTVVKILLIISAISLLFYLRDVVFVILTSIVIATAIEPGTRRLVKLKFPRLLAVIIIYLILVILLAGFFYLVVPRFITDLAGFMNMVPKYITALNIKSHGIGSDFFGWKSAVQGLTKSESVDQAVQNTISTLSTASGSILDTLTTIFGGAASFVLILVISFYLAVQHRGIEDFLELITPLKNEAYVIDLWRRTQLKIGRWMQGQIVLAIIIGILVFIALTILKVQHPFFLALISAVFEIIPVFGAFLGSVPGVMVAFLQGGTTFALVIALTYLIVQQVESNIIYPIVVKKFLDLPPLVVIIALIVGAKLGGFLGVLLSVPLATGLMEFTTDVAKDRVAAREKNSIENVEV